MRADEREAAGLGATGVLFFVLDRSLAISGGRRAEVFLQALRQAGGQGQQRPAEAGLAV